MEKKDPRLKKLEKDISLLNTDGMVRLIGSLRNEYAFSGVIGIMAELYTATSETIIRAEIEKFFNDLKDQDLAVEVLSAIEESANEDIRNALLSSCWQSRIDYSDYIDYFIDYAISGSYINALDCLTVVEQSVPSVPEETRKRGIKRISAAMASMEDEKKVLLREIISILEG